MRKAFVLLLLAIPAAAQTRPPEGSGDGWYQAYSSGTPFCTFQFLDIATSGTAVNFVAPYAAAGDPPAQDDGGAVVSLPWPFPFYGQARPAVVLSPNGYLAFAQAPEEEDGRDFSPDQQLPSAPSAYFPSGSPHFGAGPRLYPWHQDLDASGGVVLWQAFDPCPRLSEALGTEPCTVVQWDGLTPATGGTPLRFQAVLYHHTGQVAFQYAAVNDQPVTIGWQGDGAQRGFAWSRRESGRVAASSSLCLFSSTYPPGGPRADLESFLAADAPDPLDTNPFVAELAVANGGPSPAEGVVGRLELPAGLALLADPCGAASGWNVGTLSPEAMPTCTVTLQADGSFAGGELRFSVGASTTDPEPANNVAVQLLNAADDGDGVAPAMEDSYPGGDGWPAFAKGDGNGDGIPDRQQATVATLPLASGKGWVTVEVMGCSALQQVGTLTEAASGTPDPAYDFPRGLVRFVLPCPAATVKLLYHLAGVPSPTYRALDAFGRWKTLAATRVRDRGVWGYVLSLQEGQVGDSQRGDGTVSHLGGPAQPTAKPGRR